MNCLNGLSQ